MTYKRHYFVTFAIAGESGPEPLPLPCVRANCDYWNAGKNPTVM
jgi:hypothetical protein